jgi:hypothetical protein
MTISSFRASYGFKENLSISGEVVNPRRPDIFSRAGVLRNCVCRTGFRQRANDSDNKKR